jgi:hypothetical protein
MRITNPTDSIHRPARDAVQALIRLHSPDGFDIPMWLERLIIIAYQNGRYDEACSETIAAAID